MTTAGKILVVLNMLMGIFFMAFAMIVYQTRADLRGQMKTKDTVIAKANADLSNEKQLTSQLQEEKNQLTTEADQAKAQYETQIAGLTKTTEEIRKELSEAKTRMNERTTVADVTTDNQTIRDKEIEQLRGFREELISQKSELIKLNTSLKDELQQKGNDLKLTLARNEEMVERIGELERYITVVTAQFNVPAPEDLPEIGNETVAPPPNIEGVVEKVDKEGKFFEISLGEDDGIKPGQILLVWRNKPEPKYLGKVKIFTAEAGKSVATPVSINGLIQPADRVGPNIAPYRAN